MNILIALYNTSYKNIHLHAVDEYLAVFAQKTVQFVQSPGENIFIPRKSTHANQNRRQDDLFRAT